MDIFNIPAIQKVQDIVIHLEVEEELFLNAPIVVSHIRRIGCQPEKTTLHGGQPRSWSAEQGKENKKKPYAPRSYGGNKNKIKHMARMKKVYPNCLMFSH